MDNIFIYLTHLPNSVSETVTPCIDGYTIYINSDLTYERQIEAYDHALRHIVNHDFEKADVQKIEADNHKEQ